MVAVNIREPTFAPWCMGGGIGLPCRYGETTGIDFLNLQLSGPGAAMGMCSGRELSGLPKKLGERIRVERNDGYARAVFAAKGRRIFDVEVELGDHNDPLAGKFCRGAGPGRQQRGSCPLSQHEAGRAPGGWRRFPRMPLVNDDSVTDYRSWEPCAIAELRMGPSLDDPWAELAVESRLGGGYSVNSNRVPGVSRIAQFEGDEADRLISYLFTGRWDRSTICAGHQRYEGSIIR